MTDIIRPGAGIIFMKVGTHAQETLETIISRKTKEIEDAGFALWGYGGNTCHPQTMVQPFAESFIAQGKPIYLCMHEMNSKHFAEPLRAEEFSSDNVHWEKIPSTVHVRGSRYALKISSLREEKFDLPLDQTRVTIGLSQGRLGSRYIQGRVDKACLEILPQPEKTNDATATSSVKINLVAELAAPYAYFLRGYG